MTTTRVWITAFRLRTLPLAVSSVGMGGFLAARAGVFRWDIFMLCVATTIFLQILSNLANDYGDSVHGADSAQRKGPARTVQSGQITSAQMKIAIVIFVALAFFSGIVLLIVSFGLEWRAIIFFLALGILCILAAIAYTVGRKPYGYAGLGDVSVLIFFGLVGVLGSYYLFTKTLNAIDILPALSCGAFATGVLNINNIRDIASDKEAGKFSIPVRIGRERAVFYHWFLLSAGIAAALLYTYSTYESPWQLLFLLCIPAFVRNGIAVSTSRESELDPFLKQMALSTLAFVSLFGTGLVLSS